MEKEPDNLEKQTNHKYKKTRINWIGILLLFSTVLSTLLLLIAAIKNIETKTIAMMSLIVIMIYILSLSYLNDKNTLSNFKQARINTIVQKIFSSEKNPLLFFLFDYADSSNTIGNTTHDIIIKEIQSKLSIKELNLINLLKSYKLRLEKEIENLRRKGNYNLTIGLIATITGGFVLVYMIIFPPIINQDRWIYGTQFITKLSIVVLFEFFAFFFLRLYKNIQEDIKFYQNEITNIELKTFAAMTALASNDETLLKPIIDQLATTERNFVLKKGETTVGLERERMDRNEIIDLVRETIISTQRKNKNNLCI